eukprot:jgi/Chrpa1/15990/Chrysochromulina_OHIO_Genome00024039-RA
MVDVGTLAELKGVSQSWLALARRVLCSRLSRYEGQPAPTQLAEITDLNIKVLVEAGRPWEAAAAGRMLPSLARLRWEGFTVSVAAVREVNLETPRQEREFLGGRAKVALLSCIEGEGEPPLELLLAAVACAGSGEVRGIPVQMMRENSVSELDLCERNIGVQGGMLLAHLVPVMGALTSVKLRGNKLGDEGWGAIFAAICGSKDSKIVSLDASGENIGLAGGKLIAKALGTSVTGALTRVDVRHNNITGDGAEQLSAAVLGNLKIEMFNEIPIKEMRANSLTELDLNGKYVGVEGGMVVAGLIPVMGGLTMTNLLGNQLDAESAKMLAEVAKQKGISLCGIQRDQTTADIFSNQYLKQPDAILLASDLSQAVVTSALTTINLSNNVLCCVDKWGQGTYTAEGITAIADALRVNGALTSLDLSSNHLCGLDTHGSGTYTAEGITAIADALRVNGGLTSIDLSGNQLCGISEGYTTMFGGRLQQGTYTAEGITAIADALRVNGGLMSLNLSSNQLCGFDCIGRGTYTAEGITAIADALRVNGALTKLSLAQNFLKEAGTKAICEALEQNTTLKELDISGGHRGSNTGGSAGAKHVAKMVRVNGGLAKIDLRWNELGPAGAVALAPAIAGNGALTSVELRDNKLGDEGWGAIFAAICGSKDSKIMSMDVSEENIGPAGVKLIAEALCTSVTGGLTRVDVRGNNIAGNGAVQLAAAVLGNLKIEMFNEIPIKEMRADSFTELDLKRKDVGVEGGMVVAGLIPAMGGLTNLNLSENKLCGLDVSGRGTYTAVGITAIADAMRVNGGLTSLNLSWNRIGGYLEDHQIVFTPEGPKAIADALLVNGGLTVTNLLGTWLDAESAKMLAEVAKQKGISLCGIRRDQTTADFSHKGFEPHKRIEPPDAILLASDLSQAIVTGALTALNLSSNCLKDEGVSAVCKAIRSNKETKLVSLNFGNNGIGSVGGNAVAAMVAVTGALTSIDLSSNRLTNYGKDMMGFKELAAALGANGALTALNLSSNDLKDEGVRAVCEAIQSNKETKLASLNMGENDLGPVGATSVVAMVAVTGGLTKLDLSNNKLCGMDDDGEGTYNAEGITAIADALRVNGGLTKIDLSRNRLGAEGAAALAPALAANGGLTKMSLAKNELGEEGTRAICEALEQNTTLKELDISGEYKGNIGGAAGAKHVAKMLGVNGGLTSINLSTIQLCGLDCHGKGTYTAEGITAIADAMRVNGALTKLSLANNMLGEEGTKAICKALEQNTTLKQLDISGDWQGSNIGGTAGAKHVAKMLGVNGGLTSINLSGNHLTNYGTDMTGIKELAAALGVNGGLTVTNLLGNELNEKSAKMLAEIAKQKGFSLCGIQRDQTTADFSDCNYKLKQPDAILLASDLSQAVVTGALTECNLSANWFGAELGAKQLADALRVNGALTKIK